MSKWLPQNLPQAFTAWGKNGANGANIDLDQQTL